MYWQKRIKKIAEFEAELKELSTNIDDKTIILFEDESYIRDYQALTATWALKGQQKQIKTYGQHKGVGLFGALDYQHQKVFCETAQELKAQDFQAFLENTIFPAYPDKKIIMILDNGKIHHAKILKPFKEQYKDKIEFKFLPPYAPNINRIEPFWKWLKHDAICNQFLNGPTEIAKAVFDFLHRALPKTDMIKSRLCW